MAVAMEVRRCSQTTRMMPPLLEEHGLVRSSVPTTYCRIIEKEGAKEMLMRFFKLFESVQVAAARGYFVDDVFSPKRIRS